MTSVSTIPRLLLGVILLAWGPAAARDGSAIDALAFLSLEELMDLEVTLASRRDEKLFEAASAVFVLTREDIRRSGASSIPEALRLVPGIQVARIDASKWSITPREGLLRFANKLLVLVDGRSVYSPVFSGVFWEIQDLVLEDVDRIEVIRGPGATLWGANAVNGIINIVTQDAAQTQGTLVTGGLGTEERAFGAVRHGGRLGEHGHLRIYAKSFARDASVDGGGRTTHDAWDGQRAGFRADWSLGSADDVTLQGEAYTVDLDNQLRLFLPDPPYPQDVVETARLSGSHVLGSWRRQLSAASDLTLQVYFDRTRHRESFLGQRHHTWDLDVQHHLRWGGRHELVWGAWGRLVDDDLDGSFMVSFEPERRRLVHYSVFAQDGATFFADRLRLVLGSKFEHNPYTGLETQPNLRLLWTARQRYTVWGAVSRAVRTPSRAERDGRLVLDAVQATQLPAGVGPVLIVGEGRDSVVSEVLTAVESGIRLRPNPRLSVDVAAFLHIADKQAGITLGAPVPQAPPLGAILPVFLENGRSGEDVGLEALVDWETQQGWRQRVTYTYLHKRRDAASSPLLDSDYARHNLSLWSQAELPGPCTLDAIARYVSALSVTGVPAYATLDLRLAWQPRGGLELAVAGRNLLEARHAEAVEKVIQYQPTQVQRGVYTEVRLEL